MDITWLGQAGFLIEVESKKILIDPYLSASCFALSPDNYRRMPIDKSYLEITPDVLVLTHDHLDHTDPDTLEAYLGKCGNITVLAAPNAWDRVRKYGNGHNYVRFSSRTEWTANSIRFAAVKAEHSDPEAIGVIIECEGKKIYHTGDTLFNTKIFKDIPSDIYAMLGVVNGRGNNMNSYDAERFAKKILPKYFVPMHWGLHDDIYPDSIEYDGLIIPKIYEKINFERTEK